MRDEREPMNIWQLEEYAKNHGGYQSGRFIALTKNGLFEFQWLDAYYGFIQLLQPETDGFFTKDDLRAAYGDDQEYIPTVGYDR